MDFAEIIREVCVDSKEEALKAQKLGADRIELCSRLDLEGLTPSHETIKEVISLLHIPIKVMIRPRQGDFVYTKEEIDIMAQSIDYCKLNGASGVVFGVLDRSGNLDLPSIQLLAERAKPMEVTIHKAIDQTNDPVQAIKQLRALHLVDSVLTSGKAPTADEGKEVIKEMMLAAGEDLKIVVAGKVKYDNLAYLHKNINALEYHGRNIIEKPLI